MVEELGIKEDAVPALVYGGCAWGSDDGRGGRRMRISRRRFSSSSGGAVAGKE